MWRIRDVYPGSWFLPIPDLGSRIQKQEQKRGVKKKICRHTYFCSLKFHKIVNYFIFEMLKKTIWANFQRIIELLPKKLSLSSQIYGFGIRYPRSGIRKNLFRIPGSKRDRIPDPQHWMSPLKKKPVKGLCGRCWSVLRPPPLLWPQTPPPPYTLYTCVLYTHSHREWREGGMKPERRLEGK